MRSPIVPSGLAVVLLALLAPAAVVVAAIAPGGWLAAPIAGVALLVLTLLDGLLAPRLRDLKFAAPADIEVGHPNAMASWRADPEGFCPPGGETHLDLRRRSAAALADIIASGMRTVVVSHGVSGAVLRGLHLGLDARAMFVLEKPQDAFFRLLDGREERILAALETA